MTYSSLFKCKQLHSCLLQNKNILDNLKEEGFKWIRRVEKVDFHTIVRDPTLGCLVELSTSFQIGSIDINSRKAKNLIYKLCYF